MSEGPTRKKQQNNNTTVFLQNRTAEFLSNPTKTLDVIVKRDETVMGNLTVGNDLRSNNFYASGNYYLDNYILVPPGTIIMSAAHTIPEGWLECDGRLLNISDYPALHAAIGHTFNYLEQDQEYYTFFLPDLRGRCVIGTGLGNDLITNRPFGVKGGEETHTLTTGEMPSHTHGSNANGGDNGYGLVQDTNSATIETTDTSTNEFNVAQLPKALTIDSAGEGGAHNNMQPYIALRYLIKY